MEQLFKAQLMEPRKEGVSGIGSVWRSAVYDVVSIVGPAYLEPVRLWTVATLLSASLIVLTSLSFCTGVVYGGSLEPALEIAQASGPNPTGDLVSIAPAET